MIFGKHINRYYLKYWYLFLLGIIALIAVDYVQLLLPEILGRIVNNIQIYGTMEWVEIKEVVIQVLFIGVIIFAGRFLWRLTLIRAGFLIEADMRKDMFVHAEKMSVRYFQEQKVGALMALFTNDLETIENVLSDGTIFLVDAFFLGGMALIKMLISNWILGLIAIIPLAILVGCGGIVGKVMSKKYEERQEAYENMSDFAQENFTGLSVIKAFVKEAHEIREFSRINRHNKKVNVEFVRYGVILDILIDVLVYSVIVIIMALGGYFVFQGDGNFIAGDVTEFIGYFNTIVWPMLALAQIINMRSRGRTSLKRVSELLDEKVEILDRLPAEMSGIRGEFQFNHFSFIYPGAKEYALKDLNFTIRKGETIGVVGKIGSGKSTFVNIFLHLYNVEENTLLVDGVDFMRVPIQLLRDEIGYVPQDNFLFSDLVRKNITFAKDAASEEEMIHAAEFADIDENIRGFRDGYDTLIGERGTTLSGGQKQRISIARAILKDPSVLILDDAVSAVDIRTEEKILKNIARERKGKTTIIVASRISTVQQADRILVLSNGEVEAFASHQELLEISPTYRRMAELQTLEKEMEGNAWQH